MTKISIQGNVMVIDKDKALNRAVHKFGKKSTEPTVKEDFIKEVIRIEEEHMKRHPCRKMTLDELKEFLPEAQKAKMKELWDNKADEAWEKI